MTNLLIAILLVPFKISEAGGWLYSAVGSQNIGGPDLLSTGSIGSKTGDWNDGQDLVVKLDTQVGSFLRVILFAAITYAVLTLE